MTGEELSRLYEAGNRSILANLDGVTHEESLRAPPVGGNTINWILGHILASRGAVLSISGVPPTGWPALEPLYSAGDDGCFEIGAALPLERLVGLLAESQELLRAALPRVTAERLGEAALLGSVADTLAFLAFHEGYHSGQIGILRRVLGKPGKIRPPRRTRAQA